MKIAVVNDNNKKLKMWSEFIPEATMYSHPSFTFLAKEKDPSLHYDILVLDRMFYGQDLLEDDTLKNFRKSFPKVKLVLSSALHVESEKVPGLDHVIDQWPVSAYHLKGLVRS